MTPQEREEKIIAWEKRVTCWSEESINTSRKKEGHEVNYHWGFHAGMCSMAAEARDMLNVYKEYSKENSKPNTPQGDQHGIQEV